MIEDGWQIDIVDKKRRMAVSKLAMRRIGNQITWQPCAGCQLCKYVNTFSLYFFQDVFVFSFVFLVRSCECELCGNSIVQIASFMTLAPLRHFEVEDFGISGSASQLLMTIFPCLLDMPDDQFLWMSLGLLYQNEHFQDLCKLEDEWQENMKFYGDVIGIALSYCREPLEEPNKDVACSVDI